MDIKDPQRKADDLIQYAKTNKEEVIVYALLAIGVLALIFFPKIGEFILGALTGYYFSNELSSFFQGARNIISSVGRLKYVILAVILFALFWAIPTFFLTGIVVAAVKQFIFANNK